jgi:hypothetical protein
LQAFISPWIYDQANATEPIPYFYASDFSAFIRNRPYVVEVGPCQIFRANAPQHPLDWIETSSPLELLISADSHLITPIT